MTFSNSINWLRRDGPRWENLGITLSSGVFKVTSSDGTALSQSNAAYVTIPSRANPGQQKVFRVIADQSFQDVNGTNTLGNSLFGLTTNIAYAQDLPFYIYAAADNADANLTFFISRVPHRSVCPVAANIGQSGNTNASTQGSFFALQAITAANFDSQSCICIGAFRMRYSSSASPWTVQTLSDGSSSTGTNLQSDGIGCFHEGTKFNVATGQFGAAAGSFFTNNGGTAPAWTSQSFSYQLNVDGKIRCAMSGATSSAGAGAVVANIALPFINIDTSGTLGTFQYTQAIGVCINNTTTSTLIAITSAPAFVAVTNALLAVALFKAGFTYEVEPN